MGDIHSQSSPGQGRIRHVSLTLTPDFENTRLRFKARYTIDRPVRRDLHLDIRNIEVTRAISRGSRLKWDIDSDDPILGQRLVLRNLDASNQFSIEGASSTSASALQWLTPQMTASGVHPFLYSQCQAIHARSLFPCQDTPVVRFTFDAQIDAPKPLNVVMGAASYDHKTYGALRRFRFRMPQPIPSYLFAFAVGEIAFRSTSHRCGVYAEPSLVDPAAWEFARAEEMIRIAEGLYGPYLWQRYDVLVMPKGFPWGGMENPRLTFLTPSLIAGTRDFERTLAHELGHAWTGNLVTNATWEHFWLNEGWTTYIEHRILESLLGPELMSFTRCDATDQLAAEFRRLRAHPERTALTFPMGDVDPDEAVSPVPYIKGALFLEAIEQVVGRPAFDRFTRAYIRQYSFRSITTSQFLRFLTTRFPRIAKRIPLHTWVARPGQPPTPPRFNSALYRQVRKAQQQLKHGALPTSEEVSGWNWRQVCKFLDELPKATTLEQCIAIDRIFSLQDSTNPAILGYFYPAAIRAGYRDVIPRVSRYLATHGVLYYLRMIYTALAETGWSRSHALDLYSQNRSSYHPVTQRVVEGVLSEAGVTATPSN